MSDAQKRLGAIEALEPQLADEKAKLLTISLYLDFN